MELIVIVFEKIWWSDKIPAIILSEPELCSSADILKIELQSKLASNYEMQVFVRLRSSPPFLHGPFANKHDLQAHFSNVILLIL